jgi:hypothetical protein
MGGFNWDPISWVEDAGRAVDGLTKPVQRWVIKEVKKAGDLLEKDIRDVASVAHRDVNDVFGDVEMLTREVKRITLTAGGDIGKALDSVGHAVTSAVTEVEHFAQKIVNETWAHADSLYKDAERFTDTSINWAIKHVIDPAIHDAETTAKDVEKAVEKTVEAVYHDVILKVSHDAMTAWNDADKALYWIDHSGYDAVKLVEQCWDFLESVASHPASAAERVIRDWSQDLTVKSAEDTAAVAETYAAQLVANMESLFSDD